MTHDVTMPQATFTDRDEHPSHRRLLRVRETAHLLGVSERTVRTLISSGRIRSVVVAERLRRVTMEAIDEYIRQLGEAS